MRFTFDAPPGGEQYECFGFDASALAGRWLTGIDWKAPSPGGGAELHHAALYAFPQDYPDGPVPCDAMPVAWTMHLWLPGGGPMTLPPGVAVTLPPATRRFVIQAHVLRVAADPRARRRRSFIRPTCPPSTRRGGCPRPAACPRSGLT